MVSFIACVFIQNDGFEEEPRMLQGKPLSTQVFMLQQIIADYF